MGHHQEQLGKVGVCHESRHLWVGPEPQPTLKSVLKSFWKRIQGVMWQVSCNPRAKVFSRTVKQSTPPQLDMSYYTPTFFNKNIQTILRSGNSRRPSCHSRAVSKHSSNHPIFSVIWGGHKERSVWDCAWGVAGEGGHSNNICGFSLALGWLNDDMGPFLLPCKVTF